MQRVGIQTSFLSARTLFIAVQGCGALRPTGLATSLFRQEALRVVLRLDTKYVEDSMLLELIATLMLQLGEGVGSGLASAVQLLFF